jgi:dipeptidyl aminopeptidase/acylaminoacyl peptidase
VPEPPKDTAPNERSTLGCLDLFRLRLIDDPQLSPRGDLVAYVEIYTDRQADRQLSEVVVVSTADGSLRWRSGAGAEDCSPRWSADEALAFVSDREQGPQGWLLEFPFGQARRLTDFPAAVTDLDWSPAGDKLALTTTATLAGPGGPAWRTDEPSFKLDGYRGLARQRSRAYIVARDGATVVDLAPAGGAWCPRFSPDGAHVAFVTAQSGPVAPSQCAAIWAVECSTSAAPVLLATPGGPVRALCWSPDGSSLAFIGHQDGEHRDVNQHVLVADVATAAVVDVTPGMDRSAGVPVRGDDRRGYGPPTLRWSTRTNRIYFEVAEGGRGPLGWAVPGGEGGRSPEQGWLYEGDHVCLAPSLAATAPVLAVVLIGPSDPGTLYIGDEDGGPLRRLAGANDWLSGCELGRSCAIGATAGDGATLEGWLTLPPEACGVEPPWPLLVNVHGGPHHAVGWRFSFDIQRVAARGVAVLALNPRGSLGYGRDFAAGSVGDWGGADWCDILVIVDAALSLGHTDPAFIAIQGASYGGYMAQWAVTQTDRFRAAVSENGMSNLLSQWGTGADGGADMTAEMGATPWQGAAALVERSPLSYADRARTPLLLVHSELDQNCPLEQSEQMYAALKHLGRSVELAVLEGEGHLVNLVGRPSRRLARAAIIDDYLGRHLAPGPPTWT